MKYEIQFDFDASGDAPSVYITRDGTKVVEVFEDPICTVGEWSSNPENWEAGPLARNILFLLNEYAGGKR